MTNNNNIIVFSFKTEEQVKKIKTIINKYEVLLSSNNLLVEILELNNILKKCKIKGTNPKNLILDLENLILSFIKNKDNFKLLYNEVDYLSDSHHSQIKINTKRLVKTTLLVELNNLLNELKNI